MSDPRSRPRRPGEALFAAFMLIASGVLLWSAHGISGFEALSAAGTVPMTATAVMAFAAAIVLWRTLRRPMTAAETVGHDILPGRVLGMAGLLAAYAVALEPLGFLPTSALFLTLSIRLLSGWGWGFAILVSLGSLAAIWLIFRIVFTVLMPEGIVPEAAMVQMLRDLVGGR